MYSIKMQPEDNGDGLEPYKKAFVRSFCWRILVGIILVLSLYAAPRMLIAFITNEQNFSSDEAARHLREWLANALNIQASSLNLSQAYGMTYMSPGAGDSFARYRADIDESTRTALIAAAEARTREGTDWEEESGLVFSGLNGWWAAEDGVVPKKYSSKRNMIGILMHNKYILVGR